MECDCNPNQLDICPNCGRHLNEFKLKDKLMLKSKDITILPELIGFPYTDDFKLKITKLYSKVSAGKTRRNAPRRAIIYYCIVSQCKIAGIIFDSNNLKHKLNIKDKDINKITKEIEPIISDFEITIDDLLNKIIKVFDINDKCLPEMIQIYKRCRRVSPLFNSAKMETLAYGIVYYYLTINLEEFMEDVYFTKAVISKDTILKVFNDISSIIKE
jgi:hypothetical protein